MKSTDHSYARFYDKTLNLISVLNYHCKYLSNNCIMKKHCLLWNLISQDTAYSSVSV